MTVRRDRYAAVAVKILESFSSLKRKHSRLSKLNSSRKQRGKKKKIDIAVTNSISNRDKKSRTDVLKSNVIIDGEGNSHGRG